ncbi:Multivesicular body subunit 12B [Oopsacas minuta]|uniref:Multivesicular body subunit 12B n=1 Tax=Oopsacas minuta TaxID=111878 RepID=A0AAV7JTV0_9METZ|nr:Multivesicular body subunit 12B [Oopsacas minuta]
MSFLSSSKPITDIKVVSNKTELPAGYQLLEYSADGQKVQLWEGRHYLSVSKRYLCFSRQNFDIGCIETAGTEGFTLIDDNPPLDKQVVITDIKIQSNTMQLVEGFTHVDQTFDDAQPALKKHNLLLKYSKRTLVKQAVTQIIFVDSGQLGSVPPKFNILPSINGYSLCFMLSPINNTVTTAPKYNVKTVEQQLKELEMNSGAQMNQSNPIEKVNPMEFIERLPFKTSELLGFKGMNEYNSILNNKIRVMTEDEIESKFTFDFSKERKIVEAAI